MELVFVWFSRDWNNSLVAVYGGETSLKLHIYWSPNLSVNPDHKNVAL